MKVEVEIPDGKYCGGCQFCQDICDSMAYEESHYWCAYLYKDLTKPTDLPLDDVKKHRSCPNLSKIKR